MNKTYYMTFRSDNADDMQKLKFLCMELRKRNVCFALIRTETGWEASWFLYQHRRLTRFGQPDRRRN